MGNSGTQSTDLPESRDSENLSLGVKKYSEWTHRLEPLQGRVSNFKKERMSTWPTMVLVNMALSGLELVENVSEQGLRSQ